MKTSTICLTPYDELDTPVELSVSRHLSQSINSIVKQLAEPYSGQVLKIFTADKDDHAAALTLTLLQRPLCTNFPKLFYWSRLRKADLFGEVNETANMYAYRQQLGGPMSSLFSKLCTAEQMRSLLAQLTLPLVCMHRRNLLHCDVKMENFVAAIRACDPNWSESSQITINSRTITVPHCVDGLDIKPLLIDFELAMSSHTARLSDNMVTTLHTRPPELLFVDPNVPLEYNERSEAYSLAMGVLYEIQTRLPGSPRPTQISAAYFADATACIDKLLATSGSESIELAYGKDNVTKIVEYAWLAVLTLGYPGDAVMERTPLGRVIKAHRESITSWPTHCLIDNLPPAVCGLLGADGVSFLRHALHWENGRRKTLTQLLGHPYLRPFVTKKPPKRRLSG